MGLDNDFHVGDPSDKIRMSDVPAFIRQTKEELRSITNDCIPIGAIIEWPVSTVPDGFLECDGQSVLRADYAELFSLIGTSFGSVDGTHFSIPDMRGLIPRGKNNGSTVNPDEVVTVSCTTNSTTTVVVNDGSVHRIAIGSTITGSNIPAATVVAALNPASNEITISNAATGSATADLTFTATIGNTFGDTLAHHHHPYAWGNDPDAVANMGGKNYDFLSYVESSVLSYTPGNENRCKNINVMYVIRANGF